MLHIGSTASFRFRSTLAYDFGLLLFRPLQASEKPNRKNNLKIFLSRLPRWVKVSDESNAPSVKLNLLANKQKSVQITLDPTNEEHLEPN